ncbi:MAG: 30S ribosomal protein S3 [Candidatus Thermoplasmatota archaeon]|nr:30S ribosomal protein S3 [Candidatus Thermoplasmatota archaeon]
MASERKFVAENIRRVLLKEYFMKETEMAGFGGIDIQRTPMGTRVTLIVERPGMVIGRKGTKIKELTRVVSEKYGFDNPQIEVSECRNSAQNPQIMAQKLALALERGWHFRRAGHSTLRRIMESDVKGAQVKLCGKLTGQRHRTEKFKWGHIKFCGEPAITMMDRGYAIAKKKLGLIGVSVDIMRPDARLPDEIHIREIVELADVAVIKDEAKDSETERMDAGKEDIPAEEKSFTEEAPAEMPRSKRKQRKEERRRSEDGEEEDNVPGPVAEPVAPTSDNKIDEVPLEVPSEDEVDDVEETSDDGKKDGGE